MTNENFLAALCIVLMGLILFLAMSLTDTVKELQRATKPVVVDCGLIALHPGAYKHE